MVIKRILPNLASEEEFVEMFLAEARVIAQLHHPNIVEVLELGRLAESIFMAMEWVDGVDLRLPVNRLVSHRWFATSRDNSAMAFRIPTNARMQLASLSILSIAM